MIDEPGFVSKCGGIDDVRGTQTEHISSDSPSCISSFSNISQRSADNLTDVFDDHSAFAYGNLYEESPAMNRGATNHQPLF